MSKKPRSGRHVPRAIRLCQVLSNDARRRILIALADGPLNVSTIAKNVGMTTTNASVNLGTLYDHDLVDVAVDGIQRFYGLTDLVTVRRTRGAEEVMIRANDGSSLTLTTAPKTRRVG